MVPASLLGTTAQEQADQVRRRTRQRVFRGGLYASFVALVGLVALLVDWGRLAQYFFNVEVAVGLFPEIVTIAAKNTFLYTVIAFTAGLVLGLLLALMKLSPVAPYRWFATAYIELFRGMPALLTILLMAFAVPLAFGIRVQPIRAGLVGLALVAAAYMAETIRAGIEAVPKGQVEAARSLGMSPFWSMVSIVIPQAFRIVIPPMTNEMVLLIKDTSLLFIAGSQPVQEELTKFARDGLFDNANATPFVVAGLLYLAITLPLTRLVALLERRNRAAR